MDNKILPIEDLINQGLCQSFRKVFDTDLTIVSHTSKRAMLERRSQGKRIDYPFAFATPQSYSLRTTDYHPTTLLRRGITGQTTSDNLGTFNVPMIPMDTGFQILYVTNSFEDIKKFAKLWLMASAAGYMSFEVVYGVVATGITAVLEPQLNVPERDSSPDAPEEYELTTSLTIVGYASHDQLINQQAVTTVEVEGRLAAERALMQEDSPGAVQVFKFKKGWPPGNGPLTS